MGFKEGDFPNAEEYSRQSLSIPMFPGLKDEEASKVVFEILKMTK